MKIVENNEAFPPYRYFTDVEDKFLNFKPMCRVLPARYYEEYHLNFILKKRYEPGENKSFPDGGFEIIGPDGGVYNFFLDEVVVHPFTLGMSRYFSKMQNNVKEKVTTGPKGKRGRPKSDNPKPKQEYVPTGGKRGRKPLSPEEKAKREAKAIDRKKNSNGKRGRPKKQVA